MREDEAAAKSFMKHSGFLLFPADYRESVRRQRGSQYMWLVALQGCDVVGVAVLSMPRDDNRVIELQHLEASPDSHGARMTCHSCAMTLCSGRTRWLFLPCHGCICRCWRGIDDGTAPLR